MAKSSLTFSERRKVLVLGSSADHAVRTLTKQDCGKIIVLTNPQAHAITLPTAAEAGEGWNCRFILGTLHNDRSVRDLTTITAQGTETVSLVAHKAGGALTTGVLATAEALEFNGNANGDTFTITVPVAAGGTATTFTFTLQDADHGEAAAAGAFVIKRGVGGATDTAARVAAVVKQCIDGTNDGPIAAATLDRPATGEGSVGTGIQGITCAVTNTDNVTITSAAFGAAGSTIAFTEGAGDNIIGGATLADVAGDTVGVDRTGASLSTRTIQITEGATAGDQVEVVVVNGQWQAKSYRAE